MLALTGHVTAFDHYRQRLYLIENVFLEPGDGAPTRWTRPTRTRSRLDELVDELARPLPYMPSPPPAEELTELPPFTTSLTSAEYQRAVEVAREHILAGDIFQVVLAQRFDLEGHYEPFDVYRVLRQVNPSPYMYFLRHEEATLVGSSPEPMVQVLGGRVISRPIAGTRFRGRTEEHDRMMAAELSEDPKERAEHVMLVDLARNDVGRVVRFGTEQVDELMTLERYSHVMHLTSQVSGELAEGRSAVDVLRATFPAGTVSGAPKVRAMEIIDELEPVKRGRTPASSGTSTSPGTSTPRSRSARCSGGATRRACRRGPGSSPTPIPSSKTWNATTRRRRCSRQRLRPASSPPWSPAHERIDDISSVIWSRSPDRTRSRSCRASSPRTSKGWPTARWSPRCC